MKLNVQQISFFSFALTALVCVHGKGGNGGGGGGRGGGGGGRVGVGRSSSGLTKSRAAVILGSGAAGYAAYRSYKNSRKDRDDKDREGGVDFDSFEQYNPDSSFEGKFDYKTEESKSYYASEGIGMSAWALIFLILGIIALGTVGWYCCNVFLPVWQDNRQMRRRSMTGRGMKDELPLQETPSTATPSP